MMAPVGARPRFIPVWFIDFVFDRIASDHTLICLVVVDDGTHESVAVVAEHTMGGERTPSIKGRPVDWS